MTDLKKLEELTARLERAVAVIEMFVGDSTGDGDEESAPVTEEADAPRATSLSPGGGGGGSTTIDEVTIRREIAAFYEDRPVLQKRIFTEAWAEFPTLLKALMSASLRKRAAKVGKTKRLAELCTAAGFASKRPTAPLRSIAE